MLISPDRVRVGITVSVRPFQCRAITPIRSIAKVLSPTKMARIRASPILTRVRIVMQPSRQSGAGTLRGLPKSKILISRQQLFEDQCDVEGLDQPTDLGEIGW